MRKRTLSLLLVGAVLGAGFCLAQSRFWSGGSYGRSSGGFIRTEGGVLVNEDTVRTARETLSHSTGTPTWTNTPGFEKSVFTFARVIFQSDAALGERRGFGRRLGWWVDYPDADLNFSYRLQEFTTIKTDPDARVLKLTDPSLSDYPVVYMEHAGYMRLRPEEILALRQYFEAGGALFVNDFWGTEEWEGFASQIERVLPDHSWVELKADHPIFNSVFDIRGPMHQLRVPTMQFWDEEFNAANPQSPPHRVWRGEGSEEMRIRAVLDDAKRIMIVAIHNSDVSDGWEREGENLVYFNQFSESVAYPLGINIIFYLMTH